MMDEFTLIEQIKQKTYRQQSLIKGVGDDAAVFRLYNKDTVIAVDTFVEGVHFTRETLTPKQIGYRVLAVNMSDIAAMGATPLYYLVSIVIPGSWDNESVKQIFSGMDELAERYALDLIGGDTVSGHELVIAVTIIGSVAGGKARYRHHAKPGDVVFVTGTVGDARAGLDVLLRQTKLPENATESIIYPLITRHQRPEPRVEFAQQLKHID